MRLATLEELEGAEITCLRRCLAPVPHEVRADLTVEANSRRVISMMIFVPMKLSGTTGEPLPRDQRPIANALHAFQGELRRVVPSYVAPLGLTCVSATETRGTTLYSIEHTPGVSVE